MREILERPFNKITVDLVTQYEKSTSGKHTSLQSLIISQDGLKLSLYQIGLKIS